VTRAACIVGDPPWPLNIEAVSDGKERDVAGRNALLIVTVALLAATLRLALPELHVEVPGAEGAALPGEPIASPRPTKQETGGGGIPQRR